MEDMTTLVLSGAIVSGRQISLASLGDSERDTEARAHFAAMAKAFRVDEDALVLLTDAQTLVGSSWVQSDFLAVLRSSVLAATIGMAHINGSSPTLNASTRPK